MVAASRNRTRLVVVGVSSIGAITLAFLAGRLSVPRPEPGPGIAPVEAPRDPGLPPGSGELGQPADRQEVTSRRSTRAAEAAIATPVKTPPSGDRGVDALNGLLEKTRDAQAMEPRLARYLQPTLEQALADKQYNPRGLAMSVEERARFLEWADGFDAVVKRLAAESEEFTYLEVLRRIAAGNELWIQAATEVDVASALKERQDTGFVIQTDFSSREAVANHIAARFAKLSVKVLSTGGSRDGTARFTAFVEGDGSRVMETAKALDEAQRFRSQAIRDYLMRLSR